MRSELLKRAGTLYILASHFHPDHFNPEVLKWKEQKPDIKYIFSKDILKRRRAKADDAIYLKKGDAYQDELLTIKAFGSTDVGISFLIETEGRRIFHAGDLKELDIIAKETSVMDLVMFPVDPRLGTDFMRGAQQFIDRIKTSVFVPMHFWERPAEVMAFGPYAESKGCRYIVLSVPGEGTDI